MLRSNRTHTETTYNKNVKEDRHGCVCVARRALQRRSVVAFHMITQGFFAVPDKSRSRSRRRLTRGGDIAGPPAEEEAYAFGVPGTDRKPMAAPGDVGTVLARVVRIGEPAPWGAVA